MAKPDTVTTQPAYTYMRAALATDRVGQCPCCLASHRTSLKGGRLARHGWRESGRQVGSFGLGFQWGSCVGSSMSPLEETDRDGLTTIKLLDQRLKELAENLAMQRETGKDTYTAKISGDGPWASDRVKAREKAEKLLAGIDRLLKKADVEAVLRVDTNGRGYQEKYQVVGSVTQKRGAEAVVLPGEEVYAEDPSRKSSGWSIKIPSWQKLREREIEGLVSTQKALTEQRGAILKAIEHHKANPSTGSAKTEKAVHYVRRWTITNATGAPQERKGLECSWRARVGGPGQTENASEVTCQRCLKSMKKREEQAAAKAAKAAKGAK